jgi:hypothetical protein
MAEQPNLGSPPAKEVMAASAGESKESATPPPRRQLRVLARPLPGPPPVASQR